MSYHKMHPYMKAQQQQAEHMREKGNEQDMNENYDLPMTEDMDQQDQVIFGDATQGMEPAVENPLQADAQQTGTEDEANAKIQEMRLRMAAEMDNFKKRLTREHQEQMRYASEKVLSDLLPALDNLDLAIQYGNQHEACKDMMQGIEMTRKQLLDAVGKNGLALVGVTGEDFNPAIHEAIGVEAHPELPEGAVSRVLQPGYKLNDRLLRPAKVMVNRTR